MRRGPPMHTTPMLPGGGAQRDIASAPTRPPGAIQLAMRIVGLATAAALTASCGGGGGADQAVPSPSRTGIESPTRSPTIPTPTRTATKPSPTRSVTIPSPTRSVSVPSPTRTTTTATATATATATVTASPSTPPDETAAEPATSDSNGRPSWVWWLLAALVLATLAAVPMVITAHRRRTWETELAA